LLPGEAGATVVRLSAKITAWYVDRDVAKSGYEVLASNGRLELDLLDLVWMFVVPLVYLTNIAH
jgi:hypothetical protein